VTCFYLESRSIRNEVWVDMDSQGRCAHKEHNHSHIPMVWKDSKRKGQKRIVSCEILIIEAQ
jgi:hypothetical protein